MSVELTVVIPTYNEKDNVKALTEKLASTLEGVSWEAIFVDDDSSDGTADIIRDIASKDVRVRCLQRIGRKGLSSACIEGMLSCSSDYMAVMDADMQHDERILPKMLEALKENSELDIVVGSRYVEGGGVGQWSAIRKMISCFATKIGQAVIRADLKDPMSGFFMLRQSFFQEIVRDLNGKGFKILFDLFASSSKKVKFKEMPYDFRQRNAGESKLDLRVSVDYGIMVLDKIIGKFVSIRFLLFFINAFLVLLLHYFMLMFAAIILRQSFVFTQLLVSLIVLMVFFMFNKTRSVKKDGVLKFVWEALSFSSFGCIGVVINVSIAYCLYDFGLTGMLSGLIGGSIGSLWNYIAIKQVFRK
ncbi:MAG: glycosyltransferase family 2 protein [Candidatus Omnitrophica bacterium]|nr:glycosyltransferase family 2 protein [Candidatus Omnitrophota bacterium]MBU1996210.1 glycosyltransferase family 2 protein [Candidatus Omnitrophota bacterium]MBU4333608.1 glycosyltransferase family 2 protein [Candidatus Omnitrophota bacterium]